MEIMQEVFKSPAKTGNPDLLPTGAAPIAPNMEQTMESTIKYLEMQQKALYQMIRLDVRNFLNLLTAHGTTGNMQKQIKESIERAIIMALDFGTEVLNPQLREHGALGKLECSFAAHLAKCKENGLLLIANNMQKQEKADAEKTETKIDETQTEN